MTEQVPAWFRDAIRQGLQALVVLHLPGGPGHETVGYTRDVWVRLLWGAPIDWAKDADAWRIEAAFARLARTIDRWPAPRALLDHLPQRKRPPALPPATIIDPAAERHLERMREFVERFRGPHRR